LENIGNHQNTAFEKIDGIRILPSAVPIAVKQYQKMGAILAAGFVDETDFVTVYFDGLQLGFMWQRNGD